MVELIFLIILLLSLFVVVFILVRKIPVLATLPQRGKSGIKKHRIITDIEDKIKDFIVAFQKQVFLHKLLSWIKVFILKIEVQIDHLLHSLRKKAQEVEKLRKK